MNISPDWYPIVLQYLETNTNKRERFVPLPLIAVTCRRGDSRLPDAKFVTPADMAIDPVVPLVSGNGKYPFLSVLLLSNRKAKVRFGRGEAS
jgi:hypothetical protein